MDNKVESLFIDKAEVAPPKKRREIDAGITSPETKKPEIIRFRKALGLPEERTPPNLEKRRLERKQKTDEFLADRDNKKKGRVSFLREKIERRKKQCRDYLKKLPAKKRAERLWTIVQLKRKGIANPEEIISGLEKNRSWLIYTTRISSDEIEKIQYTNLLDKNIVPALAQIENLPIVLDRLEQLGFSVWDFHICNSPELVSTLARLGKISEENFTMVASQLDQYSCLKPWGEISLRKTEADGFSSKSDYTQLSEDFKILTSALEQGSLSNQITDVLDASQRVYDLQRKYDPHNIDSYLKAEEKTRQKLTVLEEFCTRSPQLYKITGHYLGENLEHFAKTGQLQTLAELINQGFSLGSQDCEVLSDYKVFEPTDFGKDKINRFFQNLENVAAVQQSPDLEFFQATQEYLGSKKIEAVSDVREFSQAFLKLFRSIEGLDEETKLSLLWQIKMNVGLEAFQTMEDLPHNEELVNLYQSTNRFTYGENAFLVPKTLTSFLLQKNGEVNLELTRKALETNCLSAKYFAKDLLANFPKKERLFWQFWQESPDELKDFIHSHRDDFSEFVSDGIPTSHFFEKALEERSYVSHPIRDMLTDELLSKLPEKDGRFWRLWRDCNNDQIEGFLLQEKAHASIFFDSRGHLTPFFFEAAAKRVGNDYHASENLAKLLTDKVLAVFPEDEKKFWQFWQNSTTNLKPFLVERKKDFGKLFVDGKPTPYFFSEALEAKKISEVRHLLSEEVITSFPEKKQNFWRLIHKYPLDKFKYDVLELLERVTDKDQEALQKAVDDQRLFELLEKFPEGRQNLLACLVVLPNFAPSVYDALSDKKVFTQYNLLPETIREKFLNVIIKDPNFKDDLLRVLDNELVQRVVQEFPEYRKYFFSNLVSQPEQSEKFAACVLKPEFASFLKEYPQYFTLFDQYFRDSGSVIPVDESGVREIFSGLIPQIATTENDIDVFFSALGKCAQHTVLSLDNIIEKNFLEIVNSHKDNKHFFAGLFNRISFTPQQMTAILERTSTINDFLNVVMKVLPTSDYAETFYTQLFREIPTSVMSPSDIMVLLQAIKEAGGIQSLTSDRSRLLFVAGKTSSDVQDYIIREMLKLSAYDDDTDYNRQGTSLRTREIRTRRGWGQSREREISSTFETQIKELNLLPEQKDQILILHKVLQQSLAERTVVDLPKNVADREKLSSLITDFQRHPKDLDESADAFDIYHQRLDRERKIPDFKALWKRKVREYFEVSVLNKAKSVEIGEIFEDSLRLYNEGLELYRNIDNEVVPALKFMNQIVSQRLFHEGAWFSGRDGIPLYLAMKAQYFGQSLGLRERFRNILNPQIEQSPRKQEALIKLALEAEGKREIASDTERQAMLEKGTQLYFQTETRLYDLLKYIPISRLVFENAKIEQDKENVRELLRQKGINPSMVGVDTGSTGSVMQKTMNLLEGISRENMIIWGSGKDIDIPYKMIERLPKKHDRTLAITEEGRPVRILRKADVQLLNWVAEHAIMRHIAPRKPVVKVEMESEISLPKQRRHEISEFVQENLPQLVQEEKEKLIKQTTELYKKSQEIVAPVIVGFADHLLRSVVEKGPKTKIIFVARDGIGSFKAAQALLEKFPDEYEKVSSEQLVYAYLTRKTVYNSSAGLLSQYFQQLAIDEDDEIIIADIGMYGTIISSLKSKLSGFNITDIEYLISRTRTANGFIDNGEDKRLDIFKTISGNPAVHFLEDTFSGLIQSPVHLAETEMGIEPDTKNSGYPPEIAVKREFALRAIEDFVKNMTTVDIDIEEAKRKLNDFLSVPDNFKNLMVPHER